MHFALEISVGLSQILNSCALAIVFLQYKYLVDVYHIPIYGCMPGPTSMPEHTNALVAECAQIPTAMLLQNLVERFPEEWRLLQGG